jgi:hypothetical protein
MSTEPVDQGDPGQSGMQRRRFIMPAQLENDTAWVQACAHDIKQPLAKLKARFSGLAPGDPDDQFAACVRELNEYIDELYMLSMSSRAREIQADAVDLEGLFQSVLDNALPTAMTDAVQLKAESNGIWLRVPRAWLFRILVNLVANAVRHSGCRKVVVFARLWQGGVSIEVADDGFGLSDAMLHTVNQLEVAAGDSAARPSVQEVKGYGVRGAMLLASAMDGRLSLVRSNPKDGTTWQLDLPGSVIGESIQVAQRDDALKGKVVVVLDDEPHIARHVASRFAKLGANAHAFSDELTMLTSLVHLKLNPDLYVLDLMIGSRTIQRTLEKLAGRPGTFSGAILTGKPAYVADHDLVPHLPVLTKPLSEEGFLQLCMMLLSQDRGQREDLPASRSE